MQLLKSFILEIFESEIIYEKLNSDFIRDLMNLMKVTLKFNRRSNMSGYAKKNYSAFSNIRLDKVTDDRIRFYEKEEFPLIEKELKLIIAGKTQSIVIVFDKYNDNIVLYIIDINGEIYDIQNTSIYTSDKDKPLSKPAKLRAIEHHKIAIIDVEGICDRDKMRVDRRASQNGVVLNTPEYYAKVSKQNIERYKDIISRNKAAVDNTKIIDDTNKLIERIQKLSTKLFDKSIDDDGWYKISDIYYKLPRLIQLFQEYISSRRSYHNEMKKYNRATSWTISSNESKEIKLKIFIDELTQLMKDLGI